MYSNKKFTHFIHSFRRYKISFLYIIEAKTLTVILRRKCKATHIIYIDTAAIEVTNNPELLELHFDALFETYQGAGRVILVKNNTKLKMTDSDRVCRFSFSKLYFSYFVQRKVAG